MEGNQSELYQVGVPCCLRPQGLTLDDVEVCKFLNELRGPSCNRISINAMQTQQTGSMIRPVEKDSFAIGDESGNEDFSNDLIEAEVNRHPQKTASMLTVHIVQDSYLISPERHEEVSTPQIDIISPAELSQPKNAYIVEKSTQQVHCSYFQIQETRDGSSLQMSVTPRALLRTNEATTSPPSSFHFGESAHFLGTVLPTMTSKYLASKGAETDCNTYTSPKLRNGKSTVEVDWAPYRTRVAVSRSVSTTSTNPIEEEYALDKALESETEGRSETCLRRKVSKGQVQAINTPRITKAAQVTTRTFLSRTPALSPTLSPPCFRKLDLHEPAKHPVERNQTLDELVTSSISTILSRSVTLLDVTPPPTQASFSWDPPALQQQHITDDMDSTPMHGTGFIESELLLDVQTLSQTCSLGALGTPKKKRLKSYHDSPVLYPPVLQPRVSSSYSLSDELNNSPHVPRTVSTSYYRFGSPRPIIHLLTSSPIEAPKNTCHDSTPSQQSMLTPPDILRTASCCSADWEVPCVGMICATTNLAQSDFLADRQSNEEDFFDPTPPPLVVRSSSSSRVGERLEKLDFDDIVDVTGDDLMCIALFHDFAD